MPFRRIYQVAGVGLVSGLMWVAAGCSQPYDTELLRAGRLVHEGKWESATALYEKTLPRIPADAKRERATALVGYGDCLTEQGKLREAFASYQAASEADAENLDAHLRLAQILNGAEQMQPAADHAAFVLKREPENAMALAILGGAEAAAGQNAQAKLLLERSLAIDPQKPTVAISLAQIYVQEEHPDQARKVLIETASATEDRKLAAFAWMALGRLEEQEGNKQGAEAAYRAAVKGDDSVLPNFRLAQFLERSAKIEEAEQVLKHVDAMRPTEPSALAEERFAAGRKRDALEVLNVTSPRAVARMIEGGLSDAGSAAALHHYEHVLDKTSVAVLEAELALERGDVSQAEERAALALKRSPDSAAAHYVRGLVFERKDAVAEAKEQWNSALQSEPDYVPAEIALAQQNLKEGDLKTAEQHVSAVVRDEPSNLEALCIFARVLLKEGKSAAAVSIARRAATVNPKSQDGIVVLGDIALAEKKYGAAFLEYERALLIQPDSSEALDGVLQVYRRGQVNKALLEKMERVANAPPMSPSLLEIAGRLYAAKGYYTDAERALGRSLQADPTRATAALALAQTRFESGDRHSEHFVVGLSDLLDKDHAATPTLRTLRAVEAEREGDLVDAVRGYQLAVDAGETTGVAANNLAWEYAQQGVHLDEAQRLAASAVDRNPKNPAALDTLGVVQLKRRSYTEAVASLDRAVALMSRPEWRQQSAEVYRHLAEACDGAGITAKAEQARARAAEIEKEFNR